MPCIFVNMFLWQIKYWYLLMSNGLSSIGENFFTMPLVRYLSWGSEKEACCIMLIFLFKAKDFISCYFPMLLETLMCWELPSLDRWRQQVSEDADWLIHNPFWGPDKRSAWEPWCFQNITSMLCLPFWRKTDKVQTGFEPLNLERRAICSVPKLSNSLLLHFVPDRHLSQW